MTAITAARRSRRSRWPRRCCYAKVERNRRDPAPGDNDRICAGIQPGRSSAITADLYDAGVSSYAWGYCARPGYPTVRGGTPSN